MQLDCRYKDVSQQFPFALRRDRRKQAGWEKNGEKKNYKTVAIPRQKSFNLLDAARNSELRLRFNNVERKTLLVR